eukprot:794993_1
MQLIQFNKFTSFPYLRFCVNPLHYTQWILNDYCIVNDSDTNHDDTISLSTAGLFIDSSSESIQMAVHVRRKDRITVPNLFTVETVFFTVSILTVWIGKAYWHLMVFYPLSS